MAYIDYEVNNAANKAVATMDSYTLRGLKVRKSFFKCYLQYSHVNILIKYDLFRSILQIIVAISNPPKKQDAPPKPLNFRPALLPGFRAQQPRRFDIQ